ncbi:MAG: HAMP domain-containing histidine kinase [Myxococcales bacterium]|nr:HAMP domain-containing histidine kinase [Myxococcales bacterium]
MDDKLRNLAEQSISHGSQINRNWVEKALEMRCVGYLARAKARLLTDTIYEIDHGKKVLFRANSELQREVATRRRVEESLRQAKEEAEAATALKDKFVALVSHDLMSPICVMLALSELLLCDPTLSDKSKSIVEDMQTACDNMTALVKGFLDLSRIQGGKIHPQLEEVKVKSLVASVLDAFVPVANNKEITLEQGIPEQACLFADQGLLCEVLGNLVSNAIKFCRAGDNVTVRMSGPTTIEVVDTGVGIEPGRLDSLFHFETRTSTSGTSGERGTGLGLPLALDIMKSHGGDLRVASSLGDGSSFFVVLPLGTAR